MSTMHPLLAQLHPIYPFYYKHLKNYNPQGWYIQPQERCQMRPLWSDFQIVYRTKDHGRETCDRIETRRWRQGSLIVSRRGGIQGREKGQTRNMSAQDPQRKKALACQFTYNQRWGLSVNKEISQETYPRRWVVVWQGRNPASRIAGICTRPKYNPYRIRRNCAKEANVKVSSQFIAIDNSKQNLHIHD